ncbi:MAG: rod shape-determining protein MreC, partial [Oscillospiraceae bacterium]|nr:rod shape-determining protein MreC [Oscillospiraceae bacterium]
MKNFLKEHGIWVLFAAAVIAVALALMSFFSASAYPLANLTGILASPFRSAYTAVATWFNDKQAYYQDVKALQAENAALKKAIAEMEETVRQAQADRDENKLLRQLLDLRAQRRDLNDLEAAAITEHSVTNWTSSLTLNKGTSHGVQVGNSVIDATGALVGVISEAGSNWSTVLTAVDTDTSLGARVFRTKDLGLA